MPTAPSLTRSQAIGELFHLWERRGRGYEVYPDPVGLEPSFLPFHALFEQPELLELTRPYRERVMVEPVAHAIRLPVETKITPEAAEQLFLSMRCGSSFAFEAIGTEKEIAVQLVCGEADNDYLVGQVISLFSEADISDTTDRLPDFLSLQHLCAVDFGLYHEFFRPLKVFDDFKLDPMQSLLAALGNASHGERVCLQMLFVPVRHDWASAILRALTMPDGTPALLGGSDFVRFAREKVERPLFAVNLRVLAGAETAQRAFGLIQRVGVTLETFSLPHSNYLFALSNDGYPEDEHLFDVLYRTTHRVGMLLNSAELASIAHFPSEVVTHPKLIRQRHKTWPAPAIVLGHHTVLGENAHQGTVTTVTLSPEHRRRHMHLIGATGTGKSTLLIDLALQDIEQGHGVGMLDPMGDLIEQLLVRIPESRHEDVIIFDPADTEYPIGFNILSGRSEVEKNVLSSDLNAAFRRFSTSWGDQMNAVLGNAILAFLEHDQGGTLADLRRFLGDPEFREGVLRGVRDPQVIYYWRKEFPLLPGRPQTPVLTRLDTFLRPKLIRNIMLQKESGLDFHAIMNQQRIFLAKLAHGLIGEENAHLLGTFIVSKFQQVAMARQQLAASERKDFFLYIDEFHNFITPSMAAILAGARKYRLGLVLAHQDMEQLWSRDREVASSVISNPCTRVCFRLGDIDARRLESGFTNFSAADLQNLGIGEAICRVERADCDFSLRTVPLTELDDELAEERLSELIARSRRNNATPRVTLEATPDAGSRPSPLTETVGPLGPLQPPVRAPEHSADSHGLEFAGQRSKHPARAKPISSTTTTPGRGGPQHKYLQQLIRRFGEDKGYQGTIEKEVLEGTGCVDVALEKDGRSIACEICVGSTPEHELGNVRKCLAAGFTEIVVISTERANLRKVKKLVEESINERDRNRVWFMLPDELLAFLESQQPQSPDQEETVLGYKVRVKYRAVTDTETRLRKQAIAQTILKTIKRME